MMPRFMAPPLRPAPTKVVEARAEASTAEERDDVLRRFMAQQKEARAIRAQAAKRMTTSAGAAATAAVQAAIGAARELADAVSGRERVPKHIPIPVHVDDDLQGLQERMRRSQYPRRELVASTSPYITQISTAMLISFFVGSGLTIAVARLRHGVLTIGEEPLLA